MQLRVTRREMIKAYRHQRRHCTDLTVSAFRLLALYCIECGIKALLMRQSVVEDTDALPEDARVGHNLVGGLKLLHAPVSLYRLQNLGLMTAHDRPPQQEVSATNLHQALRYGIPHTKELEVITEIANILAWLEGELQ